MVASLPRAIEEPQRILVHQDGPFQIRDYGPSLVAETQVQGEHGAAISEGFRRLARFIFGGNESSREIAMTAPGDQSSAGKKIAMTSPAAQAALGGSWVVTFYMPPGSGLANMPRPLDAGVVLREIPRRRVAVLLFSGLITEGNLVQRSQELRQRIAARGAAATGSVTYAFHNPPWTLPWMRRNEIMIEIAG